MHRRSSSRSTTASHAILCSGSAYRRKMPYLFLKATFLVTRPCASDIEYHCHLCARRRLEYSLIHQQTKLNLSIRSHVRMYRFCTWGTWCVVHGWAWHETFLCKVSSWHDSQFRGAGVFEFTHAHKRFDKSVETICNLGEIGTRWSWFAISLWLNYINSGTSGATKHPCF